MRITARTARSAEITLQGIRSFQTVTCTLHDWLPGDRTSVVDRTLQITRSPRVFWRHRVIWRHHVVAGRTLSAGGWGRLYRQRIEWRLPWPNACVLILCSVSVGHVWVGAHAQFTCTRVVTSLALSLLWVTNLQCWPALHWGICGQRGSGISALRRSESIRVRLSWDCN